MTTGAIIVMIIGMLVIWGGLAASVTWAVRVARRDAAQTSAGGAGSPRSSG